MDNEAFNKKRDAAYTRKYYWRNRNMILEKHSKYRDNNREEINAKARERYYAKHEINATRSRIYNQVHKEELFKKRLQLKERVLTHYGNGICACVKCGNSDIRVLTIDHINGNGIADRRKIGGGIKFYYWLEKNNYPKGYQTLCMNDNFIKKEENREYGNTGRKETITTLNPIS